MIYHLASLLLVAAIGAGSYLVGQMAAMACRTTRHSYRLGFVLGGITWYVLVAVVKFTGLAQ